jgi:hypothetical protein
VVSDSGEEESKSLYAFYALGLAMLVPLVIALKHFFIRKFKGEYNYFWLPIDSGLLEYLTNCFMLIPFYYQYGPISG